MIKVSDYVIQYLEQLGVPHMFMLPGGGAMHLNDSLGNSKKSNMWYVFMNRHAPLRQKHMQESQINRACLW